MNSPTPNSYPLRWIAPLAAIAGVAIALLRHLDPMLNPDSVAFVALAKSLLAGTGLRYRESWIPGLDLWAFRAPGYPLFLAPCLALGGPALAVAVQGALSGLAAALVGAITQRLGGGARAAWLAFALRLAWPVAWFYPSLLLTETLYEFLGIAATWCALEAVARRRAAWMLPAAAATTLAVLCRPVGLGLALALGVWALVRFPRAALVYGLVAAALFAPWPARNWRHFHTFVPFTTNGGATAWAGTVPGEAVQPAYEWMGAHAELGELAFDRHFRDLAAQNRRAHPGDQVRAVARRAFIYLGPVTPRDPELWVHRFAMLGALLALVLGAARRRLALPFAIWALQGAIMLPIMLFDRYRFPTEWCVVVAAGLGFEALAGRVGTRRAVLAGAAGLAACIAFTIARAHGVGSH